MPAALFALEDVGLNTGKPPEEGRDERLLVNIWLVGCSDPLS